MKTLQINVLDDEVLTAGVLTNVERELLTVACLSSMQTLPQSHETVYQCQPYIGYPKTLNAIAVLNEVLAEHGVSLPLALAGSVAYEDRDEAGAALQVPLYSTEGRGGLRPSARAPWTCGFRTCSPPSRSGRSSRAACSTSPYASSSASCRSPRSMLLSSFGPRR